MTDPLLAAIAAHGLVDDRPVADHELDDATIDRLLPQVVDHRLVGAVAGAVRAGALRVGDASYERIADLHEGWCRHVLLMERRAVELARALDAAAIGYRMLKGVSLAHGAYPDPSQRLYVDVDVIVPSAELERAAGVIEATFDGGRTLPELRDGFDREYGKEITIRAGDSEIDLHRTFVTGPIGLTIDLDELFEIGASVVVGGRSIDVLDPLHQFVHACVNAAVGDRPIRLQSFRDVAMVERWAGPDPAALGELARRWRCLAAVQLAIGETYDTLGLEPTPLSHWAATVSVPGTDRLLLRSYLTNARSYTRPLASVAVIPGVRPRLRYLRAIVRPQHEYLQARGWSQASHARRAIDRLKRR